MLDAQHCYSINLTLGGGGGGGGGGGTEVRGGGGITTIEKHRRRNAAGHFFLSILIPYLTSRIRAIQKLLSYTVSWGRGVRSSQKKAQYP